jgi:hypothetical protein
MLTKSTKHTNLVSFGSLALLALTGCGETKDAVPNIDDASDAEATIASQESGLDLKAVEKIVGSDDWKKFKKYWNVLSVIDSKIDSTDTWNLYHCYNNTLSEEKKKELASHLNISQSALTKLYEDSLLTESEYNVFKSVTNERYAYITEGYGNIFMTRMAPPPGAYDRIYLLEDLEARIDTLHILKKKDLIDDSMHVKAMDQIQQDIMKFALTNFENGYYSFYTSIASYKEEAEHSEFDTFLSKFQENHELRIADMKKNNYDEKQVKQAEKKHKEDMVSLKKMKESLPTIKLLISDLEN